MLCCRYLKLSFALNVNFIVFLCVLLFWCGVKWLCVDQCCIGIAFGGAEVFCCVRSALGFVLLCFLTILSTTEEGKNSRKTGNGQLNSNLINAKKKLNSRYFVDKKKEPNAMAIHSPQWPMIRTLRISKSYLDHLHTSPASELSPRSVVWSACRSCRWSWPWSRFPPCSRRLAWRSRRHSGTGTRSFLRCCCQWSGS